MARLARIVAAGVAHHITQRGNRRQKVFFCRSDYQYYLALLSIWAEKFRLSVLSDCLMPNHVHLIIVPPEAKALGLALREIHQRYTRFINFREKWRGHLWQGRFASCPMSEQHLHQALGYVEMNPVRAGLAASAEHWEWSSADSRINNTPNSIIDFEKLKANGINSQNPSPTSFSVNTSEHPLVVFRVRGTVI